MPASKEQVGQAFLSVLGRQATPEEIAHLSRFIDSGELDASEVGQVLQGMPEYQNKLLQTNTQQYGEQLSAQDQPILDRAAATIQSRFSGLGRPVSSGQGGALAQVGQNLAMNRQSMLADFYGRGLQQNAMLGAQQGQNALNRGYGLRDEARQRQYQIEDYYRQQNDYNTAKKSSSGWNAITPEYGVSQGLRLGAAVATGGMSEVPGMVGGGENGLFSNNQRTNMDRYYSGQAKGNYGQY